MNKISSAIRCVNCASVLKYPVLLPCGHSICKHHSDESNPINCFKCEKEHQVPSCGFPANDALAEVIEAQIEKISAGLGQTHQQAKDSCEQLENMLTLLDNRLDNPDDFIYSEISKLKNNILLKSEELKSRIDQEVDKLLIKLEDYHLKCKENLTSEELVNFCKRLGELRDKTRPELNEWQKELNEISFNDKKWEEIRRASLQQTKFLKGQIKSLEFELSQSNFAEAHYDIDHFQNINIDSIFDIRDVEMDSRIVRETQKLKMLELCEFDLDQEWKLLYRGTRDGFKARDFHSRCDSQVDTLTIIKTTRGFIFGGFTESLWDQTCTYKTDPNSFIFSLVNQDNKPSKMRIKEDCKNKAVYCSPCGPIFGSGHDFAIFFHADTVNCFSFLGGSFSFSPDKRHKHCSDQRKCFLGGSGSFEVAEVEVFRKV